jgi:hypothetical protein
LKNSDFLEIASEGLFKAFVRLKMITVQMYEDRNMTRYEISQHSAGNRTKDGERFYV